MGTSVGEPNAPYQPRRARPAVGCL